MAEIKVVLYDATNGQVAYRVERSESYDRNSSFTPAEKFAIGLITSLEQLIPQETDPPNQGNVTHVDFKNRKKA